MLVVIFFARHRATDGNRLLREKKMKDNKKNLYLTHNSYRTADTRICACILRCKQKHLATKNDFTVIFLVTLQRRDFVSRETRKSKKEETVHHRS
jgi:hypothetical protein